MAKRTTGQTVKLSKREAQVIAGPWLSSIPPPEIGVGPLGRKKYEELTRLLFDAGRLTMVMVMRASIAARFYEKIAIQSEKGDFPTASDMTQLQRALDALQIAEDLPPIASPGKKNKFALSGFALRRTQAK